MSSWPTRRKTFYSSIVIIALVLLVGIPVFLFWYKAPTCFDNVRNGKEQSVDCGGACIKLCQSAFFPPRITWGGAKFEKLANGLYNTSAYIENQNINGAAVNVPYRIAIFDTSGEFVAERKGYVNIPPHRNTIVFETAINVGKRIPIKATFEFLQAPIWFKSHDVLGDLSIKDKNYNEDEKNSSLEVTLKNNGLLPYTNVSVGVVLYDEANNAIGFSRTIIDSIAPNGGIEIAPFTWPVGRGGKVKSIEVLPIVYSPRDR